MTTKNKLWDIYFAGQESQECIAIWGADAIAWYVNTGRATTNWISSLLKANPHKLLAYLVKQGKGSHEALIQSTTQYLARYCKLS